MNNINAVLYKSESCDQKDPYCELLEIHGFSAIVIPCLQFEFLNCEELKSNLEKPDNFSGIIFSSPRSVEALSKVGFGSSKWKEKTNYSIGKTTAQLARKLLYLDTSGEETGKSEELCNLILSKADLFLKPLLFPCSNLRKETIPKVLSENGVAVHEIVSYKTIPHTDLESNWLNYIKAKKKLPDVLIYFSPSGVQFTQEMVKSTYGSSTPKCIAVGPSTAEALVSHSLQVSGISRRPTVDDVLNAVKSLF